MISVVIPALNEEKVLARTLDELFTQIGRYEVILVDGGSTDRTIEIAATFPALHLVSAPRGRARQMNAGARQANGDFLLFLHADTILPDGALARLNALESDDTVRAGAFRHRFNGSDWRLRLVSRLDNFRCARTRIMYGDQAIFVRPHLFRALGGFPEVPFLEDIMFSERLLGETNAVLLNLEVVTDARKFVQMGPLRTLMRCLAILVCYELRLPIPAQAFFTDVR